MNTVLFNVSCCFGASVCGYTGTHLFWNIRHENQHSRVSVYSDLSPWVEIWVYIPLGGISWYFVHILKYFVYIFRNMKICPFWYQNAIGGDTSKWQIYPSGGIWEKACFLRTNSGSRKACFLMYNFKNQWLWRIFQLYFKNMSRI